jgi:DNA-binding transcriptional MerR regulator
MEKTSISHELLLTIDQISHLTGVRKSTLRYWEKSFNSYLKPARSHSNRREYSMDDLNRVKTIQQLLEQEHLTAYGVRQRLRELASAQRKRESRRPVKSKVANEPGVHQGTE